MLTRTAIALSLSLFVVAAGDTQARAGTPVLDAHVQIGASDDTTVVPRLHAGGFYLFDDIRLAIDAHLSFSGFLRVTDGQGISAKAFDPLNVGVRYGIRDAQFTGPYVTFNGGWGFIVGDPRDREVKDAAELCSTAAPDEMGNPVDTCSFDVRQHLNARLGFGWGFRSGRKTTVGVKVELAYFAFNVEPGEDQDDGAPNPNFIERPQDAITLMLGLEFMRWR